MTLPAKARSPLPGLETWPVTIAARSRQGFGCGWLAAAFLAGLLVGGQLERTKEPSGAPPSAVELAPERAPVAGTPTRISPPAIESALGETVWFNVQTHIFHCEGCTLAHRCTRNCVEMPREDAERKGRPCQVCGGRC